MENCNVKKILALPIVFILLLLMFALFMACREISFVRTITLKACQGNEIAIRILLKYPDPKKLTHSIVYEALDGNLFAIRILNLEEMKK